MDERVGHVMPPDQARGAVRVVDLYAYRIDPQGRPTFLLLRRSPDRMYGGTWRMIGGKVAGDETAWQAAVRELREETGLHTKTLWALPSVNTFYEWRLDRITRAPAFAAEVDGEPVLDDEHDAFAWFSAADASARLLWPEQQRLVRLADTLLGRPLPSDWVIPPDVLPRI